MRSSTRTAWTRAAYCMLLGGLLLVLFTLVSSLPSLGFGIFCLILTLAGAILLSIFASDGQANRKKSAWGISSLWFFLSALLLAYVAVALNAPWSWWQFFLLVAIVGSIALSIVSLVRHEPRGLAITMLALSLGLPLLVFAGFDLFFRFFYTG